MNYLKHTYLQNLKKPWWPAATQGLDLPDDSSQSINSAARKVFFLIIF